MLLSEAETTGNLLFITQQKLLRMTLQNDGNGWMKIKIKQIAWMFKDVKDCLLDK